MSKFEQSVIVLVWNGEQFIDACLSALLAQDMPAQVIVVDNASTDGSVACIEKFLPRVQLIRSDYNLGFAVGNNVGARAATGDVIVLLNQDTVVQPGWLRAIVETFADDTIGVVGCKAWYPDGKTLQHAGAFVRPDDAFAFHVGQGELDHGQYDNRADIEYVTGSALAMRRQVWDKLGGLDELFSPAFYEEIDLCFRARRAGYRVVLQPRARLIHYETTTLPASSRARGLAFHRNRVRFITRQWDARALQAFVNAEQRAIETSQVVDDLAARSQAYWENLISLALVTAQRERDMTLGGALTPEQVRALADQLFSLREACYTRMVTLARVQPIVAPSSEAMAYRLHQARAQITELPMQLVVPNPPIQSNVPLVGKVIAEWRKRLVNLIVHNYVAPLALQQNQFNAESARVLESLAQLTDELLAYNRMLAEENVRQAHELVLLKQIQDIMRADETQLFPILNATWHNRPNETRESTR